MDADLAAQTAALPSHGQNYWPGAELLDDGLRNEIKVVLRALREAAMAEVTPIAPVEQSAGRLIGIRNKGGGFRLLVRLVLGRFALVIGHVPPMFIRDELRAGE